MGEEGTGRLSNSIRAVRKTARPPTSTSPTLPGSASLEKLYVNTLNTRSVQLVTFNKYQSVTCILRLVRRFGGLAAYMHESDRLTYIYKARRLPRANGYLLQTNIYTSAVCGLIAHLGAPGSRHVK